MSHSGFDELVMVDWSAASSPRTGRDSIWVAHGAAGLGAPVRTANPPTRTAAMDEVAGLLDRARTAGRTALVGVDFSLGYPAGFARCTRCMHGPEGRRPTCPPWQATWQLLTETIVDGADNANNRFEVADRINRLTGTALFWGRPQGGPFDRLRSLPPRRVVPPGLRPNPCRSLRAAERAAGAGIRSNFQLYGGVTVGSQVLTGVPWAQRLLGRFRPAMAVWPFETGFATDPQARGHQLVLAESWPSLFVRSVRPGMVRDEVQVKGVLETWRQAQSVGWRRWFDPPGAAAAAASGSPPHEEEGWILGVA